MKLGQPVDGMKIEDGTITATNGKSATYWELVTGKELEREATGAGRLLPSAEDRPIGKPYPRVDIPAKMTGASIFIQDMKPEGTVFGKRSFAHQHIRRHLQTLPSLRSRRCQGS